MVAKKSKPRKKKIDPIDKYNAKYLDKNVLTEKFNPKNPKHVELLQPLSNGAYNLGEMLITAARKLKRDDLYYEDDPDSYYLNGYELQELIDKILGID